MLLAAAVFSQLGGVGLLREKKGGDDVSSREVGTRGVRKTSLIQERKRNLLSKAQGTQQVASQGLKKTNQA